MKSEPVTGGSQFDLFALHGSFVGLDGTLDSGLGNDLLDTFAIPAVGSVRNFETVW